MILAFLGVALVLFVGIGGFTLALCRAAKNGDAMQVPVPPVRR